MARPKHIILLVADSLRYNSVFNSQLSTDAIKGSGLSYLESNGLQFSNARSSACWTLPATASLFTGKLPHEHGATTQSRKLKKDIPTLAEKLKSKGYRTVQITANVVTTEIFGLDRGFDQVIKVWKEVETRFKWISQLLVLIGKPRMRDKFFKGDLLMNKMAEDLEASKTWLQHTHNYSLNKANELIEQANRKGESLFLFINMMESHFPYHINDTFQLLSINPFSKLEELLALYHTVNQTFIRKGELNMADGILQKLKLRQRLSWESLSKPINNFCEQVHQNKENLIVFCSDHGENFGEQNWLYHFSNVTEAGTRVPLFWLSHLNNSKESVKRPVNSNLIYHDILEAVEGEEKPNYLLSDKAEIPSISQSFWYNNKGKTHQNYRFNQFSFVDDDVKYILQNQQWYQLNLHNNKREGYPEGLNKGINPIHESRLSKKFKKILQKKLDAYTSFEERIRS